jgi:hypothetical protein
VIVLHALLFRYNRLRLSGRAIAPGVRGFKPRLTTTLRRSNGHVVASKVLDPGVGEGDKANFEGSAALEPGANVDRENPSGAADHIRNRRVADCRTVHVESLKVRAHLLPAKRKVRQSDCKVPRVSILTVNL